MVLGCVFRKEPFAGRGDESVTDVGEDLSTAAVVVGRMEDETDA